MNFQTTAYWKIVGDCLTAFHGISADQSLEIIRHFRLRLLEKPAEMEAELVYHEEPFYLAARLAGHEAREPSGGEIESYEKMIATRTREAAAVGTDQELQRGSQDRAAA